MKWLLERFALAPQAPAFVHLDRTVTYAELLTTVDQYGREVARLGIRPGQTVMVLGDYSPEVFCLFLALALNRNILVPLTHESVIEESAVLAICGCDWRVEFARDGSPGRFEPLPVAVDNALLNRFRTRDLPGLVLFSSGSTGKPKGMLYDFTRIVEKFRKQRDPLVAIPFLMIDHFGGINTILAIVSSLGTVVTVADRSVGSICRAIEKYKVQLLPTTPSFLTLMMASRSWERHDLGSLTRISYGTEVMPQSTLDRVRQHFPGVELQQTYGLSEVGVLRSQSRPDGSLWVKLGGAGFQTRVVDDILWIKSDFGMEGYLNAESEFDADGWFNTKDRVEVDGEYFRILGRVTDIINVGGQKVYPSEF
jgi:acyl-CoA synthetase (AMP-forming)/AMP-acid ligase II